MTPETAACLPRRARAVPGVTVVSPGTTMITSAPAPTATAAGQAALAAAASGRAGPGPGEQPGEAGAGHPAGRRGDQA